MWGNIVLESSFQNNFNVGFSNYRNDTLIHLAQWQYWWWFWFSFIWTFYYLVLSKVIQKQKIYMRPKINTSFRSHGKWGDFVAAIIPATWCLNIILNSNFILKLLEWQTESTSFTLRIRARQWYWVYKIDSQAISDIINCPKNVGFNKWLASTFTVKQQVTETSLLHLLRQQSAWTKEFWASTLSSYSKPANMLYANYTHKNYNLKEHAWLASQLYSQTPNFISSKLITAKLADINKLSTMLEKYKTNVINFTLIEDTRWVRKQHGQIAPIRLIKYPFYNIEASSNKNVVKLLKFRFNQNLSAVKAKNVPATFYFVLKQKRYRKRTIITYPTNNNTYFKNSNLESTWNLDKNKIINTSLLSATKAYDAFRKNKKRSELASVTVSKRLLRTKRTLALPANFNMTIITNSFDVVHSWFIPSLGIKLDCVPGRSTHHTFFIEQPGFFYGQCAEICGRYHHHMPIRICALPYEHYLVWWHSYAITRVNKTPFKLNENIAFLARRYSW